MQVCRVCPIHKMEEELPPYEPTQVVDDVDDVDGVDDKESESSSSCSLASSGEAAEVLHRSVAGKRPHGGLDNVDDAPIPRPTRALTRCDVGKYLSQFDLDDEQQIAICRTWANYLAAKARPKEYRKKVKK